jgi:hypothetical protein
MDHPTREPQHLLLQGSEAFVGAIAGSAPGLGRRTALKLKHGLGLSIVGEGSAKGH